MALRNRELHARNDDDDVDLLGIGKYLLLMNSILLITQDDLTLGLHQ